MDASDIPRYTAAYIALNAEQLIGEMTLRAALGTARYVLSGGSLYRGRVPDIVARHFAERKIFGEMVTPSIRSLSYPTTSTMRAVNPGEQFTLSSANLMIDPDGIILVTSVVPVPTDRSLDMLSNPASFIGMARGMGVEEDIVASLEQRVQKD